MDIEKSLLNEIKKSKTYSNLSNEFILKHILTFLKSNPYKNNILIKKLNNKTLKQITKDKEFKNCEKEIKKNIGELYNCYLISNNTKKKTILKKINSLKLTDEILLHHKSTKERINYYKEIYLKIFDWHKPDSIADLGCGLNPISIFLFSNYKSNYFASDLSKQDMEFLNEIAYKFKLPIITKDYDLTEKEIFKDKNFLSCETVFLFKTIDSLEKIKRNYSKEFLIKIPQKYIVISFPTKTLTKKTNFTASRNWVLKLAEVNNWEIEKFEVENELFFLITKHS